MALSKDQKAEHKQSRKLNKGVVVIILAFAVVAALVALGVDMPWMVTE